MSCLSLFVAACYLQPLVTTQSDSSVNVHAIPTASLVTAGSRPLRVTKEHKSQLSLVVCDYHGSLSAHLTRARES